jgi:type IV secretory pathway VirB10-like protein
MRRAQSVKIFSRGWMIGRVAVMSVAVLSVVVLGLLATPSRAPAQDAGVSGIAPGPANARGLNGSVSDPSGIGNAAKVPAIPPPVISPVPVPTLSAPAATYRAFPVQRTVRMRPARFAASRSRRSAARAAVTEKDRLLDHKLTSICRGC